MYYKTVKDLIGTKREASGDGWKSRRFLLAEDGLPFSLRGRRLLGLNKSCHPSEVKLNVV